MRAVRLVASGLTSLILLSALVSGGAWWARSSLVDKERAEQKAEKQSVATVTVLEHQFELSVVVVGKLEAVKSTPVMAGVSGKVVRTIQNGARVKRGDVIVELDSPRMAREVRSYQSQYQAAEEQLKKQTKDLAMDIERAEISLNQTQQQLDEFKAAQQVAMETKTRQHDFDTEELGLAKTRFERTKRQVNESLLPRTDLESGEAAIKSQEFGLERQAKDLQLAEAQQKSDLLDKEMALQRAKSDLQRAKDTQGDELRNAKTRLQTLQQQLDRAKEQLAKATIRAPEPGIVVLMGQYGRFGRGQEIQTGDQVYDQMKVATIPNLSQMRVALELSQEQVRRVKRGVKARVTVETAPGQVFSGAVTEISQNAQEQIAGWMSTGERVFQVYVLLKDTKGAYLRPGTTSVATLIIERVPKALTLPLECVFDRDGKKVVYLAQRDGSFRLAAVELGVQNEDEVVVKRGLHPGDRVAMHDMKGLGAGASAAPKGSTLPIQ